jgi:hypothetical protein
VDQVLHSKHVGVLQAETPPPPGRQHGDGENATGPRSRSDSTPGCRPIQ